MQIELIPENQYIWDIWVDLDMTGRNRGMGEEYLREEAIDSRLKREQIHDLETYRKLIAIERVVHGHHLKKQEEERKRKEKKP